MLTIKQNPYPKGNKLKPVKPTTQKKQPSEINEEPFPLNPPKKNYKYKRLTETKPEQSSTIKYNRHHKANKQAGPPSKKDNKPENQSTLRNLITSSKPTNIHRISAPPPIKQTNHRNQPTISRKTRQKITIPT